MDSQRRSGRGPSSRITRSWYPGGRARTRRTPAAQAAETRSRGTRGLGTDVGYWGRVDSEGEFDENAGFLAPLPRFWLSWRSWLSAVRRLLPLCAAALVGAVTALAWQSFLLRPLPSPAAQPVLPAPAASSRTIMHPESGTEKATVPAGENASRPSFRTTVLPPGAPTAPQPAPPLLLGSAPPRPAGASSAVAQPRSARRSDQQASPARRRSSTVKAPASRATRPTGRPGRPAPSPDPDAILRPSFL
jgi:hypothetical protein